MTEALASIWCETCDLLAPMDEWRRKIHGTRVVSGNRIVGYVSIYEHSACRVFTAVAVKAVAGSIAVGIY